MPLVTARALFYFFSRGIITTSNVPSLTSNGGDVNPSVMEDLSLWLASYLQPLQAHHNGGNIDSPLLLTLWCGSGVAIHVSLMSMDSYFYWYN